MTEREQQQAELLEDYWAALSRDLEVTPPAGLDEELTAITQRLERHLRPTAPEPGFSAQLWQTLQATPDAPPNGQAPARSRRWPALWRYSPTRWRPLTVPIVLISVALSALAIVAWQEPRTISVLLGQGETRSGGSASWAFDVSNPRKLANFSTNIFVGRVVAQTGNEGVPTFGGEEIPHTQFSVEVLENIKGELTGTVTVDQFGGYAQGELIFAEGDALLEPGRTYLFVTRWSQDRESYRIAAEGYGHIRIDNAQEQAALVAKWEQAHRNEIPWDEVHRRFLEPTATP